MAQPKKIVAECQRGFTLLEILVAMTIGLFMLGAILTIEQSNKVAFSNQNSLAQLQDGQRMAMTMITDVVQSAGYFPNPHQFTISDLTASGNFALGQSITGSYNALPPGDSVSVRYETSSGDGILNCSGTPNASGGNLIYANTFSVLNGQLICSLSVNGGALTQYTLVGDGQNIVVQNMSVMYGVNTSGVGNNVDTYLNAGQVTNWNNVISIVISLTFNNPLFVAGQKQPQLLTIQRAVNVMSHAGPVK